MNRYFIKFSYFGTYYRGLQKNAIPCEKILMHDTDTIQGAIESAFATVTPKCITWPRMSTSSRTDAGVHGLCNTAHIDIENKYGSIIRPEHVLSCVNRYLVSCNHNIRLLECIPVTNDFHARFLAKSRTYLYRFMRAKYPDEHRIPLTDLNQCFHLRSDAFDFERVQRGVQLFLGVKDFTTFSAKSNSTCPVKYVRQLNSLIVEKGQPLMPYDPLSQNFDYFNVVCSSKAFLYKQIRRIVGALIALGTGKITERDITIMLQVPNHKHWPPYIITVPPNGLYLMNVEYCPKELENYIMKCVPSSDNQTTMSLCG